MTTRSSDNALIYHYKVEVDIVDEVSFRINIKQNLTSIKNCKNLNEYFNGPIERILYEYKDPSDKVTSVVVEKSDCQ